MEEPKILSLNLILDAIKSDPVLSEGTSFYRENGLFVALGMDKVMRSFLRPQSPYLIDDYRCGMVLRGELLGRINLIERHVTAGELVYITPGSFVEPLEISKDFCIHGIGMTRDVFHLVNRFDVPEIFKGEIKDGIREMSEEEIKLFGSLFHNLWELIHKEGCSQNTKYSMISTLLNYINDLFKERNHELPIHKPSANAIFDRFIYLVNMYAAKQRQLSFYAGKMCITDRYLGTVIRQVSGITAKEWVDRAVITCAKVMLRHGSLQIAQIADELNFPNPSFFCKYFKRLTGSTPLEYREG